jgi:hypothetical protein
MECARAHRAATASQSLCRCPPMAISARGSVKTAMPRSTSSGCSQEPESFPPRQWACYGPSSAFYGRTRVVGRKGVGVGKSPLEPTDNSKKPGNPRRPKLMCVFLHRFPRAKTHVNLSQRNRTDNSKNGEACRANLTPTPPRRSQNTTGPPKQPGRPRSARRIGRVLTPSPPPVPTPQQAQPQRPAARSPSAESAP